MGGSASLSSSSASILTYSSQPLRPAVYIAPSLSSAALTKSGAFEPRPAEKEDPTVRGGAAVERSKRVCGANRLRAPNASVTIGLRKPPAYGGVSHGSPPPLGYGQAG